MKTSKLKIYWILFVGILILEQGQAAVVIKNFRQIYESLAVITGVDGYDPLVRDYYQKIQSRLPKEGKAEEITGPSILGFAALSGLFCKRMIEKDQAITDVSKRRAHAAIDFKKSPNQIDEKNRTNLIRTYTDLFWQREPSGDEMNMLLTIMKNAQTEDKVGDLKNILIATCTSVAGSLTSLIY